MEGDYVAFLGGTETFGKFIEAPFPDLLEADLGTSCVNFGLANAGVDVFLNEPSVLEAAHGSSVTIVQVLGAHNLSNRFYAVHPRRNDRFVRASSLLQAIFRDIDFTDFSFTRAMLTALRRTAEDKFDILKEELQTVWLKRMKILLEKINGQIVLLWLRDPREPSNKQSPLGIDPLFIEEEMVMALIPHVTQVVEVFPSEEALELGTDGMVFDEFEATAAAKLYGPRVHNEIAAELIPVIRRLCRQDAA